MTSPLDTFKEKLAEGCTQVPGQGKCIKCGKPFTDQNVFTPAGWREVKISSCCEACFDAMFGEDDET